MTIMKKKFLLVSSILVLLTMVSCSSPEKRVCTAAEDFLKAYYSGDCGKAAKLCTPRLAELVSKGAVDSGRVPGETVQKMKEASLQTSFKIISVDLDRETGKAVVHYELTIPGSSLPIPKDLALEIEGRTAAVDGIE